MNSTKSWQTKQAGLQIDNEFKTNNKRIAIFMEILYNNMVQFVIINFSFKNQNIAMQNNMIKKADRLTRQSFALLDRIKSGKQRQDNQSGQKQDNYLQDLYIKLLDRHPISHQKKQICQQITKIFIQQKNKIEHMQYQKENLLRQKQQSINKMGKQKDGRSEVQRMKALNQQIEKLEQKYQNVNSQIRGCKIQNQLMMANLQKLQLDNIKLTNQNKELQEIVEKFSIQLQNNLKDRQKSKSMQDDFTKQIREQGIQIQFFKQLSQTKKQVQVSFQAKSIQEKGPVLEQKLSQIQSELQSKNQYITQLLFQIKEEHNKVQQIKLEFQINIKNYQDKITNLILDAHQKDKLIQNMQLINDRENSQLNLKILVIQKQLVLQNQQKNKLKQLLDSSSQKIFQISTLNGVLKEQLNSTAIKLQNQTKLIFQKQKQLKTTLSSERQKQSIIQIYQKQKQLLKIQLKQSRKAQQKLIDQLNQQRQQLSHFKVVLQAQKQRWLSQNQQLQLKINQFKQRLNFFKMTNQEYTSERIDLIKNRNLLAQNCYSLQKALQDQHQINKHQMQNKYKQWKDIIFNKQIQYKQFAQSKKIQSQLIWKQNISQNQILIQQLQSKIKQNQQAHKNKQKKYEQQIFNLQKKIQKLEKDKTSILQINKQLWVKLLDKNFQIKTLIDMHQREIKRKGEHLQDIKTTFIQDTQQKNNQNQDKGQLNSQDNKLVQQKYNIKGQLQKLDLQQPKGKDQSQFNLITYKFIQNQLKSLNDPSKILVEAGLNVQNTLRQQAKVIELNNKHLDTIKQLTDQLTEAYSKINYISQQLKQIKSVRSHEQNRNLKQKNERGKSIKQFVGIFGF